MAKEATAITQLMIDSISTVMSSCPVTLIPSLDDAELSSHNREPVATGSSNVVLVSRSIHKSCYPVWRSSPGNGKLVFPRQSFRRVEVYWLPALDPRQAYVIQLLVFPVPLLMLLVSIAGSGKSVLWCALSRVFPAHVT